MCVCERERENADNHTNTHNVLAKRDSHRQIEVGRMGGGGGGVRERERESNRYF